MMNKMARRSSCLPFPNGLVPATKGPWVSTIKLNWKYWHIRNTEVRERGLQLEVHVPRRLS